VLLQAGQGGGLATMGGGAGTERSWAGVKADHVAHEGHVVDRGDLSVSLVDPDVHVGRG